MPIQSFKCRDTEKVFTGIRVARFAQFHAVVERKLRQLNIANTLDELRSPAGNHLEALAGNRQGQHSIRINKRYRVCFIWTAAGPTEVEVIDYHS
ncbi:proteic killer suppression protein [Duganella sp. 1224]|uniref:type II toxin-antitoxin system RelE/ParE family toxin n=1 Tax=Duganella sp. 1224 TaxID=2587052 RepID=UPI0015CD31D4|nr:type II toxin-antitoxin system RelE/ParE family toxin [Duganella sp. 1224]NYE63353.1 proteic killer suppression protein [Duganella sp. 1224]